MALTRITEGVIKPNENYVVNNINSSGVTTSTNFKTGTSNLHNVGIEIAGINVLGADTPIGTGATIYDAGGAVFTGVVTATSFSGSGNIGGVDGNFSGNVTGVDGTFTGNVSIGGTLTYEDVTNIDSVGLVTARDGVFIPDNKKLELGNAAGSGDLTIKHFAGGHSYITDTSNDIVIQTGVLRVVNAADNQNLATFSQGGASDLYFAGAQKITTASSGVNIVGTTTTGQLAVTGVSTFSGNLDINANIDVSGQAVVSGDLDVSADIRHIGDVDTRLRFETDTITARTAGSERLRINSDGRVNIANSNLTGSHLDYTRLNVYGQTAHGGTNKNLNLLNVYNYGSGGVGDITGIGLGCGASPGGYTKASIGFIRTGTYGRGDLTFYINDQGNGNQVVEGDERLRITSGGNVAINKTSGISAKLHIGDTGNNGALSQLIKLGNDSSNAGTGAQINMGAAHGNESTAACIGGFYDGTGTSFVVKTAGTYSDQSTVGERFRITSNGRVNIGTAELDQTDRMLNVYGGRARIAGIPANSNSFEVYASSTTGQSHGMLIDAGTNSSDINAHFRQKGGANLLQIKGDGKVSVGTVQTTHTLGVTGGSSSQLLVKGGEADIWMTSTGSGSDKVWRILGSTGGSTHQFRIYDNTGGADRLVIDANGRLSCGPGAETGSLSSSLHVRRNQGGTAAGESVIAATCGDHTTMNNALLTVRNAGNRGNRGNGAGSKLASFEFNDASALVIDKDGNVGINQGTPVFKLDVNGTGRFTDDLTITSGKKIKTTSSQGNLTIQPGPSYPGGSIKFAGGQSGATDRGTMIFYAGETTSLQERMRLMSDGRTGINTSDPRFNNSNSAASNYFYQNDPKFGVHGSITIGNLSSTAADKRELAFYRRGGPTPGTSISNHHMGRVAWYGSSNDSAFPDMAWSLDCTANGGGWTAGSNRHGYLSFVSGRSGELIRITHDANISIGFAGAPDTRVHIKGNSDNGTEDATVTIEDTDDTAGSKEPILAFDGNGTRQARILSSDATSTTNSSTGGLYFGVGSSNDTVLQCTSMKTVRVHNDVRGWATVEYNSIRQHTKMFYSPGNAVATHTILRIRRYWWGWGSYKIRCKAIYYNSSLESTYYVNGHGSGGNHYSISNETFGGDASSNSWNCTVTHAASNNSPGGGSPNVWYTDVKVNIPNYYYVVVWVEAWGSSYSTDPTSMHYDSYCLM